MEPAIHALRNRKYQSWEAHQIRLQVWNFTSGGCKERGRTVSSGSIFALGRGLFPWQYAPNQEDDPSFSMPTDQSPKSQRRPGSHLPGWQCRLGSISVKNSKRFIYLDILNFSQLILMLLSHSQSPKLESEKQSLALYRGSAMEFVNRMRA